MTNKLPSPQTALELLRQAGCSKKVVEHCKAVSALAIKFANICKNKGYPVDVDLVEVGALLHDIGRSKTHDVDHAVVGVEIAESLNLPASIVSIIECHIGGGIGENEAKMLGLPVKDYLPTTMEQKIVCYADKLISGNKVVPIEHTIESFSKKLGPNHPAIDRVIRLHEELFPLLGDWNANSNTT
ncbi:MAG: TIGR00295 family protein [Candidatus Bathyarchaeota archaeon]|nr:TIGR00295 family protein [Candidatus Bathyarchaeota archaeon]